MSPIPISCESCLPFGLDETATHLVGLRPFFTFTDWRGGVGRPGSKYLCRQHAETIVRADVRVRGASFLEIRVVSFERLTS